MKNSPISNTVRNVLYIYLWRLMPRRRVKAYYRANAIVIAKATVDAPDSMRIAILENVLPVVPKFCRYDFLRIFEFVVICQDNGYTL